MGASGWDYVTRYDGDVEAALEALRARVFQEEYGDGSSYRSIEEPVRGRGVRDSSPG